MAQCITGKIVCFRFMYIINKTILLYCIILLVFLSINIKYQSYSNIFQFRETDDTVDLNWIKEHIPDAEGDAVVDADWTPTRALVVTFYGMKTKAELSVSSF